MLGFTINAWVLGVFGPSSPACWPPLPQPSWATTKETTAWRFGA